MEIKVSELRQVLIRILDHIIDAGISEVEIKENHYWDMSEEDLYSVNKEPSDLDIGSLHDDWEFVSSLLDESNQPLAYQLTELAPLIRYIGEEIGRQLAKFGG